MCSTFTIILMLISVGTCIGLMLWDKKLNRRFRVEMSVNKMGLKDLQEIKKIVEMNIVYRETEKNFCEKLKEKFNKRIK